MSKIIEITVLPNGQTKVETKGFVGTECRQASQFIEKALGQQIDEVLKAEFHQSTSRQQSLQEGGCANKGRAGMMSGMPRACPGRSQRNQ